MSVYLHAYVHFSNSWQTANVAGLSETVKLLLPSNFCGAHEADQAATRFGVDLPGRKNQKT